MVTMNGIARQRICLFSHAVKTDCYMWICFFAADQNEFQLVDCFVFLFCIIIVYIYLTEF